MPSSHVDYEAAHGLSMHAMLHALETAQHTQYAPDTTSMPPGEPQAELCMTTASSAWPSTWLWYSLMRMKSVDAMTTRSPASKRRLAPWL